MIEVINGFKIHIHLDSNSSRQKDFRIKKKFSKQSPLQISLT